MIMDRLILTISEIPISTYEDFTPLIERTRQGNKMFWDTPIKWFAVNRNH
jgi:hypothetical protein